MRVVRFIGDPTGYVVADSACPGHDSGWIQAKVGITDRVVWINISQAYLQEIEADPPPSFSVSGFGGSHRFLPSADAEDRSVRGRTL